MVGGAGRGDWLAGDHLPCVLLAAVPSLAVSEGKVAELDHVLSGEGKGGRGGAAVRGVEGVGVGQQSGEVEGVGHQSLVEREHMRRRRHATCGMVGCGRGDVMCLSGVMWCRPLPSLGRQRTMICLFIVRKKRTQK